MEYKRVAVLILTYNNKVILENLLKSIKEKTHYPNYEIFVIDNGGSDGTDELIKKQYDWIKLIKIIDNKGFIGGFNEGFKKVEKKYDFYLFLCDDIYILTENWLKKLIKEFDINENLGAIFPVEIIPPEFGEACSKEEKFNRINIFLKEQINIYENWANTKSQEKIALGHVLEGPCLLIRAEVLKLTGLFEPLLFPAYCEDTDLGLKILRAGYITAKDPNVGIIHFHSVNFSSLLQQFEKRLLLGRNRIIQGLLHRKVIDLIRQLWFEFKTFIHDILKLKINFLLYLKSYVYIVKNLKKILQARKFRQLLFKNAKHKEFFIEFRNKNLHKIIFQPPMFDAKKIILCQNKVVN